MQQLKIEHKNTTEKKKDRREGKGRLLAISRNVFYLSDLKDVYYVQSQHSREIYYYVKYNPDVFESWYCSCKDNTTRHLKCKHLFAIEFSLKWGVIKDIDQVPSSTVAVATTTETDVKQDPAIITTIKPAIVVATPKNYKDDDYTFDHLNEKIERMRE